ncbi:hypothetical protein Tco_1326875 [Tanacetum coccineum]
MIGNKAYLVEYQNYNGGPVAFGGSKGQITGKGKIITGKLDFEDLPDENQVLLRIPRQNHMYNFNLENIVPSGGLACLIAKATVEESNKWHTLKVFSNMSRKGVKFSGKFTPLFDSMLVPHQAPEGEGSEQPTEPQPTPSPTQPSTGDQPPMTDSSSSHDTTQDSRDSLEGTNGSEED